MAVITLLTDFGEAEYTAMMKGVILNINPDVHIIDVSHSITPQNVFEGAFVLKNAVSYFPEGTIHVGVVDPGVGSKRKSVLIECESGILIGPDNGLLYPAAMELGLKNVYEISNQEFMLKQISGTFHGRDVFAPTAAKMSLDPTRTADVGPALSTNPVELDIPPPKIDGDFIHGTIIHIDTFGNLITNVSVRNDEKLISRLSQSPKLLISIKESIISSHFHHTYYEAESYQLITLISSSGYLEFAIPNGSAKNKISANSGDKFKLRLNVNE